MDPAAALDAVADTDLDDATVTVVTCVCCRRLDGYSPRSASASCGPTARG